MPNPCKLKEIDGAMWARLDIDWDGGPVSLYTEIEIKQLKQSIINDMIHYLHHWDRLTVRGEYD